MRIPAIAAIVVVLLFLLGITITLLRVRKLALDPRKKRLFVYAILVSVIAKIAVATFGHNYDVNSYCVVSNILEQGKSVYAETTRYNYGPIWAWLVSGFGYLSNCNAGEHFHLVIAAFLATVDVMIGIALAENYSWTAAMVFLLSPISLLISGFHSQFDNLAVLIALLAWLMIREGKPRLTVLTGSSALLGISLIVKHIMFLFPLWLLFWKPLGRLRYRLLYVGLAFGIFGAAFLPWWVDPASRAGIVQNVFQYKSAFGNSLGGRLIELFVPLDSLDDFFFRWFRIDNGLQILWMAGMLAAGIVLAMRNKRELFLLYLMVLYVSSPSISLQYTAIPMIACAVFWGMWESRAFLGAGTMALLLTRINFFAPFACYLILGAILKWDAEHVSFVLTKLDLYGSRMFLDASQLCLGAVLIGLWRDPKASDAVLPARARLLRSAALIAVGTLPMILTMVRRLLHMAG